MPPHIITIADEAGPDLLAGEGLYLVLNVARWSGPAQAVRQACVAAAQGTGLSRVYIVDHDRAAGMQAAAVAPPGQPGGHAWSGYGDVLLIRAGEIVYRQHRPDPRTIGDELRDEIGRWTS